MPLNILKKKIGAKLEASQGSVATLSSTDYFNAWDIEQEPAVEFLRRQYSTGSFTQLADRVGQKHRVVRFKFELKGGTTELTPHQALFQAVNYARSNGANGIIGLTMNTAGTGGASELTLVALGITGGGGSGAAGYAIVKGGVAIGAIITAPGSGYTTAPTVVAAIGGDNAEFDATRGSWVQYAPISAAPSSFESPAKTITINYELDGRYIQLVGCVGNINYVGRAGERLICEATFMGTFSAATTSTLSASPTDYDGPIIESSCYKLFGTNVQTVDFSFTLDAEPNIRPSTCGAAGIKDFIITGRDPKATLNPELETVATLSLDAILSAGTLGPLEMSTGTTGNAWRLIAPQAQLQPYRDTDRTNIATTDLDFMLKKGSIAVDQELLLQLY